MKFSMQNGVFRQIACGKLALLCVISIHVQAAAGVGEVPETARTAGRRFQASSCSREGDGALYVDFAGDHQDIEAGKTISWMVAPGNFAFVSSTCTETDTFCLHAYDTRGWTITADPPLGSCYVLEPAYVWWQEISVTAPCEIPVCEYDTLIIFMAYCGGGETCNHECRDVPGCEDPNWYDGTPYFSADTVILHVTESMPALYVLQDTLFNVGFNQSQNYVPFSICNGDPCAGPDRYEYTVTNRGHIGAPFEQGDTTGWVPGGECEKVYAVVDASVAEVCDIDTLTIIAWDLETGTAYDTCVLIIHCLPIMPVPILTPAIMIITVLAAVIIASVMMLKRYAHSTRP